jgi:hypothetical protein
MGKKHRLFKIFFLYVNTNLDEEQLSLCIYIYIYIKGYSKKNKGHTRQQVRGVCVIWTIYVVPTGDERPPSTMTFEEARCPLHSEFFSSPSFFSLSLS